MIATSTWRLATWGAQQRRVASFAVLGASIVVLAAGAAAFLLEAPSVVLGSLVFLLLALLVFQGALFASERRAREEARETTLAELEEGPPALEEVLLTLRCGHCQTVFDFADPGTRPLRIVCPGCSAEAVLEAAAPLAASLRVRCPRCRAVAELQDTGERPLRHTCASCGATAQVPVRPSPQTTPSRPPERENH